jgi:hypothetical protein
MSSLHSHFQISPMGRRAAAVLLAAGFVLICVEPYLGRLKFPSLYSDDVVRVAQLQTSPLRVLLFRPVNEHMAPVFETLSWATWNAAGRRLTNAAVAFTWVSYVPFVLSLGMLGLLIRRELGSTTTALATVAAFSLSWLHVETVVWYSASSFAWALLWTLITLLCAGTTRPRVGAWAAAALAATLAPACSAIGLLAGPLGSIRILASTQRPGRRWAWPIPSAGTALYLIICSAFHYRDVLADSVRRNIDLRLGLSNVCRAPVVVLVPGLFGAPNLDPWLPDALEIAVFAVGLIGVLAWAWRSPHRPLILGGLWLIVGGYGLTYGVRSHFEERWLFHVQRYHLFPHLGLVLLLAPALGPWLRRLDTRPMTGLAVATALAAVLLAAHRPEMRARARHCRFPEQRRTLAALERLAEICRHRWITRPQALAALDPIRTRWFPHDLNALAMLPETVEAPGMPDDRVRSTLLASLTASEREALCGGMDASPYLRPAEADPVAIGRLVGRFRVEPGGTPDRYVSPGRPAYLEFQMADAATPQDPGTGRGALALCLPTAGGALEVWWRGDVGGWSETRSVRWQAPPTGSTRDWAVPLDRLPHCDPARVRRIRVFVRTAGPVTVGAPRLLR